MPTVTVIYPRHEGARFDFDYYENVHLPLVRKGWGEHGLTGAKALRGTAAAQGGEAPFVAIALISFESAAAHQSAMAAPIAGEIRADVANFTDIRPIVQVNEWTGEDPA